MESEKKIELKAGAVVLRKPLAKERNKAVVDSWKGGAICEPLIVINLLPLCVKEHPFGRVNLIEALGNLEVEEYDKLSTALKEMIVPPEDTEKKSTPPSSPEEVPKDG